MTKRDKIERATVWLVIGAFTIAFWSAAGYYAYQAIRNYIMTH